MCVFPVFFPIVVFMYSFIYFYKIRQHVADLGCAYATQKYFKKSILFVMVVHPLACGRMVPVRQWSLLVSPLEMLMSRRPGEL